MQVLKFIFVMLEVLVLFNILIFVHELGHFLAARWRGLKVTRFAIWFGKPIWKKKINGVEYALGYIPAGGYVNLPQMAPMDALEGKHDDAEPLPPVSALDKIIVAFGGPLFSFALALAFALLVWVVGQPVSETETTTVIGYVEKNGPADAAGLRAGDRILKVDGKPVTKFLGMGDSVMWHVVRSEGPTIPIQVEREGKVLEFNPVPSKEETKAWQRKSLRQIRIAPAQSSIIFEVIPNSPASLAGLKGGDQVLEVDGNKLYHNAGLVEYIEQHPGKKLTLKVQRGQEMLEIGVTPEVPLVEPGETPSSPRVGVVWNPKGKWDLAHPNAFEQVRASVSAMTNTISALFSRRSDIKAQHLSGPVKILSIYYLLFESEQGFRLALWFTVVLNVNLALLNLLPLPVLDGGHIVLSIIEAIRRRPVSVRVLHAIQTACAVVLIGYMLYIAFFDVQELPWKREKETPLMKFAPKSQTP